MESRSVYRAALLLGALSVVSSVLGLFRDRLLASTFGAGEELDIYFASFRIPDILFSLSLFFVASTAFIPLFVERKERSHEEANEFYHSVFTTYLIFIIVAISLSYMLIPVAMHLVVPGFSPEMQSETALLSRILLLSPLLLGISNLVSGVIQSAKKFLVYALSPIAYNVGIIIGILFFVPKFHLSGLAYGVVLGALLHFLVQVPSLASLKQIPRLTIKQSFNTSSLFMVRQSLPRATALSLNQFTLFVLTAIASTLGTGAISIFNLSHNLYALPLVVIGLSYSVAAFPNMAKLALSEDKQEFYSHLVDALRHILFWTLPVTALFFVLRAHIVRLVLGAGVFGWVDTRLTIASLLLFSFAIAAQSLVTLFVRGYYALGRVREPIVFNTIASLFTIVGALAVIFIMRWSSGVEGVFAYILRVQDLENVAYLSLPFAFSMGAIINAFLLGRGIFRFDGSAKKDELKKSVRQSVLLAIAMGTVSYTSLVFLRFISLDTVFGVLLQGSLSLFSALLFGIYLARYLNMKEYKEIRASLIA